MKVILLADADTISRSDLQCQRLNRDSSDDLFWVARGLRRLRHQVTVVPFGPNLTATIRKILTVAPDVVFNGTEHVDHDRTKAAHVASLLELLRLPYTGSGPPGNFPDN